MFPDLEAALGCKIVVHNLLVTVQEVEDVPGPGGCPGL